MFNLFKKKEEATAETDKNEAPVIRGRPVAGWKSERNREAATLPSEIYISRSGRPPRGKGWMP
jgi:hypothetical protein